MTARSTVSLPGVTAHPVPDRFKSRTGLAFGFDTNFVSNVPVAARSDTNPNGATPNQTSRVTRPYPPP
jgi:hypothetical protein